MGIILFNENTHNMMDYITNMVHMMDQYIYQFKNHVPDMLRKDKSLYKDLEKDQIDLLMFLSLEGEEILRNKAIKLLENTLDYMKRKHNYLTDHLNRVSYTNFSTVEAIHSNVVTDLMGLQFYDLSIQENDISYAYNFSDIVESVCDQYESFPLSDKPISKMELKSLIDMIFSQYEHTLKYLISLLKTTDGSVRPCLIVKEIIYDLVKTYVWIAKIMVME